MARRILWFVREVVLCRAGLALLAVLGPLPVSASALELGVEAGPTVRVQWGKSSNFEFGPDPDTSALLGILIEHSFRWSALSLDVWGDLQYPLPLSAGSGVVSDYLPVDLGLRVGWVPDPFELYLGILGQLAFAANPAGATDLNAAALGIGGDLGVDIAFWVLRAGLEARAVQLLTPLSPRSVESGSIDEIQALFSVRAVLF